MRRLRLFVVTALCSAFTGAFVNLTAQTVPQDFPQWRGPQRDGSVSGFAVPATWPERLVLAWKVAVGEGYGTPILVGERVYTLTRQGGNEVMAARHAATGAVVWQTSYTAPHTIMSGAAGHGQGPKSTPLYLDGRLHTLGITGIVSCFDAAKGTLLWQKPAPPVATLYSNSAMSPIADGRHVIFHVGGHDRGALTAFDAATGDVTWRWDGDGPAYASPVIVTLGGVRQVVTMTQRSVVGVDAGTGALLWRRPFENQFSNHSISPIVYRDTVIISGYEMGVVAFAPMRRGSTWEIAPRWETAEVSMFMSNPVLIGDTLYGLSQRASGQFYALDAASGRVLWRSRGREATNTAVMKLNDLVFLLNDDGELIVAKSSPTGLETIRRYTVAEDATWAQPVLSGNRIFVKDLTTLSLWTVN